MTFIRFNLQKSIVRAINEIGFEEPSPVQNACIPKILSGKDIIGQAQTGTGKTAAFGIPIVEMLSTEPFLQAVVLTPTRELAIQVSEELRKIARYKNLKIIPIYGGQSIEQQIRSIRRGVHVIIGTPGRVLDHIRRRTLNLENIKMLVLDEADEMLDMGFIDDIEQIIRRTPRQRQSLLFSATMPYEIKKLANRYLNNYEFISVNNGDISVPSIQQIYYKVLENNKLDNLCMILDYQEVELGIIFCRTKKSVDELTESLQARGYIADGIHGDLSQSQREKVMKSFRDKTIDYLIATDVAARGIDVSDVTHVLNYDIPQDPESYVHRIGRTGRAGKEGKAITLVTPRELKQLRIIEDRIKAKLEPENLPAFYEIAKNQEYQLKNQITDFLENNQDKTILYQNIIKDLEESYSHKDIALAALNILFYDKFYTQNDKCEYDFGDTGAKPGMVRFFLNKGKNVELTTKEIIDIISKEIDITAQSIGRINVFDKFSFVEVKEEYAPFVFESLKSVRVNGQKLMIFPAKPREKDHSKEKVKV